MSFEGAKSLTAGELRATTHKQISEQGAYHGAVGVNWFVSVENEVPCVQTRRLRARIERTNCE